MMVIKPTVFTTPIKPLPLAIRRMRNPFEIGRAALALMTDRAGKILELMRAQRTDKQIQSRVTGVRMRQSPPDRDLQRLPRLQRLIQAGQGTLTIPDRTPVDQLNHVTGLDTSIRPHGGQTDIDRLEQLLTNSIGRALLCHLRRKDDLGLGSGRLLTHQLDRHLGRIEQPLFRQHQPILLTNLVLLRERDLLLSLIGGDSHRLGTRTLCGRRRVGVSSSLRLHCLRLRRRRHESQHHLAGMRVGRLIG